MRRRRRTERGLVYALTGVCAQPEDMKMLGLTTGLAGKRIVVQGIGNVGHHAARSRREAGARVIGIAVP